MSDGWGVPPPNPTELVFLSSVGQAMLFPGSSIMWREVFFRCNRNPGEEITKTILQGVLEQAGPGRVEEALKLGEDLRMVREPAWLTRSLATAEGGDVEEGVRERLEARRLAARYRAEEKELG